jgi:hypothetical protein
MAARGRGWACAAALACAAFAAGCGLPDEYRCTSDGQCVAGDRAGRCETSGFCSFSDGSCATGRRYGSYAASTLADQCVSDSDDLGIASGDGTPPSDGPPCGAVGEACCAGGACAGGALCGDGGVCDPCGQQAQPCCGGETCGANLTCTGGTCQCGADEQACCGGLSCAIGTVCMGGLCSSCGATGGVCCPNNSCQAGDSCNTTSGHCETCAGCGSCGAGGQACCTGNACAVGFVCQTSTCNACGAATQPCCGTSCGANLVCTGGTCACGASAQPCCGGTVCNSGYVCSSGSCTPCGASAEPCCASGTCNTNLTCTGGTCGCGAGGQACCGGTVCNNGYVCNSGSCAACGGSSQLCCSGSACNTGYLCSGGSCAACGAVNQPCCTTGSACGAHLTCASGTCKCGASGQPCCGGTTCNATLSCLSGGTCGVGIPPSTCPTAGVLICDGFDGSISSVWSVNAPDGSLTSDTTHVMRGTGALKVHVNAVGASGFYANVQLSKDTPPLPQNPTYVRLFIWVPSTIPAIDAWILNYQQETDNYGGSAMELDAGRTLTIGDYRLVTSPTATSAATMPLDQWVCLEYQLQTRTDTSSTSFLELLQADTVIDNAGAVQILSGEPLTRLFLGFEQELPPNNPAFDYWIDEVAVDNKPIGCSK